MNSRDLDSFSTIAAVISAVNFGCPANVFSTVSWISGDVIFFCGIKVYHPPVPTAVLIL